MQSSETVAAYDFEQLEPLPQTLAVGRPQDVLAVVRVQAEQLKAKARAEGEAEGRAEGLRLARVAAEPAIAALAQAAGEIAQLREQLAEQFERDAVELALRLAEQIVAGALAVQPERVLDIVRGALRRLSERRRVTVLVHPDDLELVSAGLDEVSAQLGGIEQADAQADRRVARGGAVVRTVEGAIDAQLDTQLARAQQIVAQELSK